LKNLKPFEDLKAFGVLGVLGKTSSSSKINNEEDEETTTRRKTKIL
jgi:hypothetical protein